MDICLENFNIGYINEGSKIESFKRIAKSIIDKIINKIKDIGAAINNLKEKIFGRKNKNKNSEKDSEKIHTVRDRTDEWSTEDDAKEYFERRVNGDSHGLDIIAMYGFAAKFESVFKERVIGSKDEAISKFNIWFTSESNREHIFTTCTDLIDAINVAYEKCVSNGDFISTFTSKTSKLLSERFGVTGDLTNTKTWASVLGNITETNTYSLGDAIQKIDLVKSDYNEFIESSFRGRMSDVSLEYYFVGHNELLKTLNVMTKSLQSQIIKLASLKKKFDTALTNVAEDNLDVVRKILANTTAVIATVDGAAVQTMSAIKTVVPLLSDELHKAGAEFCNANKEEIIKEIINVKSKDSEKSSNDTANESYDMPFSSLIK